MRTRGIRRLAAGLATVLVLGLAGLPAGASTTITHGFITSFDNTPIAYTLMVPDTATASSPAPVVFMTHGWGGTRTRTATGIAATLLDEGYVVFTWDQRGFGDSGGSPMVDSQEFEVRDVQTMIDWVADPANTGGVVELDGPGDPVMGMIGFSYAGGIQLMTASADLRIDAIVPFIVWNDLPEALKPGGVLRLAWDLLLYGAGLASATADGLDSGAGPQTGSYPVEIHRSFAEGTALNDWSAATYDWFDARSPKHYINGTDDLPGISAATLLVEGTNDTLFPINHAIEAYNQVTANGADAKMIFYCGALFGGSGHTVHSLSTDTSCEEGNQGTFITNAFLAWFDKHLNGASVSTGAAIDYQLQDGTFASVSALPTTTVSASGSGTIANTVAPTSGSHVQPTAPAPDGFLVPIPAAAGETLLGIPEVTLNIDGVGLESYVFMRLLDRAPDGTYVVVDDQVTALKVTGLDPLYPDTYTRDLAGVAWEMELGHELLLEVTPTSNDHASSRVPSVANISVTVTVPVL